MAQVSGSRPAAAVLLGHRQALDADLAALAPELARECLLAVALGDARVQHLAREPDDVVAQDLLLVAEREIHQASSFSRW